MPVIENKPSNTWKWIVGCCSGSFLLVLFIVTISIYILSREFKKTIMTMSSPKPPPITTTFHYTPKHSFADCNINLPDETGYITYKHSLTPYDFGSRAVTVHIKNAKNRDLPLDNCELPNIRVGLYWYSKKADKGPILLLKDATGEQLIDMHNAVSRLTMRFGKKIYASSKWDPMGYSWETSDAGIPSVKFNGRPAEDITNLINGNRRYLGSIVKVGNKLVFNPAPYNGK